MRVNGLDYKTVWVMGSTVKLIDQTKLPFEFKIHDCPSYLDTCEAVKTMKVRGAGAIGAAAGYAMYQAIFEAESKFSKEDGIWIYINKAKYDIGHTRPTAQNLFYAVNRVYDAVFSVPYSEKMTGAAFIEARNIANEDAENCRKIGEHGKELIKDGFRILTHCNAGWLAFVDYGSALSPIYLAHQSGKKVHVYADETRPRGQGAKLTAWELANEGISHEIIPDNAAAYLMRKCLVDIVIVGADRIARNGDAANKIGTLSVANNAKEYGIPFYVAAPTSTFDLECESGEDIPIEERNIDEVRYVTGVNKLGKLEEVLVCNPESMALNLAFDVTDAELIIGIITEKGVVKPSEKDIKGLFDKKD